MKKYIVLSLLCSSYVAGIVHRAEVKYALDHPNASYLTVRKRQLQFVNAAGCIKSVKLNSLKKKQRRLYIKLKKLTEERSPYYSRRKKKRKKRKLVSFSSNHQPINYIDQSQPVDPTILVHESKLEENWGEEESRFRVHNNNKLSMDWG